ncbi:MAG: hypothetical protein H6696_14195 [Deferribacteres bacterium]|nr:hypothetical protein [Deferribacteres bacterium]
MKPSIEEKEWVMTNYPNLSFDVKKAVEVIKGEFAFRAAYDENTQEYIINPSLAESSNQIIISDFYEIEICFVCSNGKSQLPLVYETGGRIKRLANKLSRPLADLHIYPDSRLCLVGLLDEEEKLSLPEFIDGPILQFCYDESYYEKYGRWPRGQYSHGAEGIVENFLDRFKNGKVNKEKCLEILRQYPTWERYYQLLNTKKDKIKGHHRCPCGTEKKIRKCHPKVWEGLNILHKLK